MVECFLLEVNYWMYVKLFNISCLGVGVGVFGEVMYVMGGYDGRLCLKIVERYDFFVDVWSFVVFINIICSFFGM